LNIDQNILRFLKSYSYNVWDINRLMVSSFLVINGINETKNEFIRKHIISKDEEELEQLNKFIALIKNEKFDIEELIKLFEFVISPADKEVNGAVYTPEFIRKYIVKEAITKFKNGKRIDDIKFGDIACGCGGFFITIAKTIRKETNKSYSEIYRENIYGLDIQEYSIERTKIILSLLAISEGEDCANFDFNLFQGNALSFDWNAVKALNQNKGFDIIVGNPPYVGATKIDDESKQLLKNWKVSNSGKADLYIPFFEIGLENLNCNGVLGYITVNTFYKSLNGRAVRSYFSENKYDLSIIDFGGEQLFKSRSTYTCICTIGKIPSSNISYINTNSDSINKLKKKDFISIPYSNLDDFEGWYLNEKHINKLISRIEDTGEPLGLKFEIRNGFATLKNNIYVFKPVSESDEFYFFEKEGNQFRIEKDICKNAIKPNTLKSESEIENNTEKLIFPYELIDEKDLFKNSKRTIKIFDEPYLKENFPFTYEYLKTQKKALSQRDKGTREYEKWYAYGRNQALTIQGYKLLFPYISGSPCFVFTEDTELLFYNGYAVIADSKEDLLILQKILKSKVFWFYIKHTSKPYSGGFFSLAKNYVKNFGVCELAKEERPMLRGMTDKNEIDDFLFKKYNIQKHEIDLYV
jgi:adenine-specific DNA-methyltransferase